MAKMWKRNIQDGKLKRRLAALMGFVIAIQLVLGGVGPMSSYADDTLYYTITVKASELLKGVRKVADAGPEEIPEIKDDCLPFASETLREEARSQLTQYLMGTAIVKQYPSLGEHCSAIVAVSGTEDNFFDSDDAELDYLIENVVFIGLNGNQEKSCEFTLQITDADDMVIRSMTVVGYAQVGTTSKKQDDSAIATSSNAEEETVIATSADATEEAVIATSADAAEEETSAASTDAIEEETSVTIPDESEEEESGEVEEIEKTIPSSEAPEEIIIATNFDALPEVETATGSDAKEPIEENDIITYTGETFEEFFRDELGEKELGGLLKQKGKIATPGEAINDLDETRTEGPAMLIPAGGFGVAVASNGRNTGGKVAQVNVFTEVESVPSGDIAIIYAAADYSVIDDQLPPSAYFTIKFDIKDNKGQDYEGITGPESSSTAVKVERLENDRKEEWEEIRSLLESSENPGAAGQEDWVMVTEGTNVFYYSPSEKLAVFGIKNGGTAITNLPMPFRFHNGITPDGSTITATPGILNKQALEDGYKGSGPGDDSVLIEGEPITVTSTAEFYWKNVIKDSPSSMGNLAAGTGVSGEIIYKLSSQKNYSKDTGLLYTKEYTMHDVMRFDGFYLDVNGYELKEQQEKNGNYLKGEWILTKDGKTVTKVLGLRIPGTKNDTGIAVPVYLNNDPSTNQVIGFDVTYTLQNDSLNGLEARDMADIAADTLNVYLGLGNMIKNAKDVVVCEESDNPPSIKNRVEFDAYSIMHEEGAQEEPNDGLTNHHSTAQKNLTTKAEYSLQKSAFTDEECKTAATGDNKVFEPGSWVYYKLTAKNSGYISEKFRITDTLPDGLDTDSVETIKVTVNGTELGSESYTDVKAENNTKTWDEILIPSGGQATIIFKAQVKEKENFLNGAIGTTLLNKAELFRSGTTGNRLAFGDATVFVNLNTLRAEDLKFDKDVESSDGKTPAMGGGLVYTLNASLADGVGNSHWITLKDEWPSEVTLTKITEIPSQATITITDRDGKVLKTYENKDSKPGTLEVSNINQKNGIIVTARVLLSPNNRSTAMKLSGTVNTDGEIKNHAEASGGDKDSEWTQPSDAETYAIGVSIEKKAYYINRSQGAITEDNSLLHPVSQSVSFRAGDVVCYNIKLTNNGKHAFTANLTDDVASLFGTASVQYATATLNHQEGSVFKKLPGGNWEMIGISADKMALDLPVELNAAEAADFRIYLVIPDDAKNQFVENKAQAVLNHGDKEYTVTASASIAINHDVQKASIEKEVYAVAREFETKNNQSYLKKAKWNNPVLGTESSGYVPDEVPLKVGTGDYVFYRITIHNEGDEPLRIYEIEDWLPEGMTFRQFYAFNGAGNVSNPRVPGVMDETDTLNLGPYAKTLNSGNTSWLFYDDATGSGWNNNAVASVKHGNGGNLVSNTVYRARLYTQNLGDGIADIVEIGAGKSAVYGIIAQVTGNFDSGVTLTNKTGVIVDQAAITDIETEKPVSDLTKVVGGRSYSDEQHKIITATADVVTTGIYTPGIEKKLTQYEALGKWYDYVDGGNNVGIAPNHELRWNMTLHNGTNSYITKGPIENYTIKDILPLDLCYNEGDTASNYIANASGAKVSLPLPMTETGADGRQIVSWKVEKQSDGQYLITGAEGETQQTTVNLSIPVKGKMTVQVGTKGGQDGAKYGTYVNQAELIPHGAAFEEACAGTLVKDEDGYAYAVHAEASVDIFLNDRQTEAWKEITGIFNDHTQTASGKDQGNNTVIADAGSEVKYTLNVKSQVTGGIKDMVIVDRLPAINDTGVVNNMKRNSDFAVRFADTPDVTVSVKKADGTRKEISKDNILVTYTDWSKNFGKGSALPQSDWEPGYTNGWRATPEGADSLRVEISDEAMNEVKVGDTIVLTFMAKLPEAKDLNLDTQLIAWNTFGYAYKAKDSANSATITVEPLKVGVEIPTAKLSVTKKVESKLDSDKEAGNQFTFSIEEYMSGKWQNVSGMSFNRITEDGQATAESSDEDGRFTLSHGQTAEFTVLAGRGYRIKEVKADGYYVTVTDFDGKVNSGNGKDSILFNPENPPQAFVETTKKGIHYYCTFTNARSSFFLPETGGIGTGIFHRGGAALMIMSLLLMAGVCMGTVWEASKKKKRIRNK